MNEWTKTTWGDLATLEYGKSLRNYRDNDGEVPVYGTNGLIGSHSVPLCNHSGIIVGRKGAYRGIHYSSKPFFVIDTAFYLEPKIEFDMKWAYYELITQDINSMDSGSAIPSTSREAFYRLPVILPSLPEQHAIAHILGTLDDKIECNRRMNETLEAMAQAIFKSWFVDFDPVRAKAEGRQPAGMDDETAALFPNEFEVVDGREVPKGWRYLSVESICESIENGGTPKRMERDYWENGVIPWLKTGELIDGPIIDSEEKITVSGLTNSSCKLWKPKTILMALYASPTVGRLGILEIPATANQACSALMARNDFGYLFLYYNLFFSREQFQNISVGAAQQNINQKIVKSHLILIPQPKIAQSFQKYVEFLYNQKLSNIQQSRTLAALRDTLLPKLISGEIRVPEAMIAESEPATAD